MNLDVLYMESLQDLYGELEVMDDIITESFEDNKYKDFFKYLSRAALILEFIKTKEPHYMELEGSVFA